MVQPVALIFGIIFLAIGVLGFLSDRLVVLVRDQLLSWNRMETFGGEN